MAGKKQTTAPVANATDNADQTASNNNVNVIATKITSVRLRTNTDTGEIKYRIMFANTFAGKIYNRTSKEYEDADIDYIDLPPFVVIAQLIPLISNLDIFYAKKKESKSGFGAAELSVVLRNADIELTRTKFAVGEEYVDSDGVIHTHDHEGYNSVITKVTVAKAMAERLQKFVDDTIFGF